jgi:molecular chaperone GrpE
MRKSKHNQERQELMATKKNIVIEDENEDTPQETLSTPVGEKGEAETTDDAVARLKELEEQVAAAQAEARENHDRMLRLAAEFENYKKRTAREMEDLKKYATENLIRQLLTVVDNLERAIASASTDDKNGQSVVDGVALTLSEVMKILEQHHVSPIESLGVPFDPSFHQAMCQEESEDHPPNTVVQEFQKGYMIHDRLLRPAMVVVSKAAQNGQTNEKSVDTNA